MYNNITKLQNLAFNESSNSFNVTIIGGSTGIIKGQVDTYNDLPSASGHTGELYYVKNNSGGSLTLLGIYKYPKGLYSSDGTTWELTPLNVQVAEDSLTLNNIVNWSEFLAFAKDIYAGDILIYNSIKYTNLTGNLGSSPDSDTLNWSPSVGSWVRGFDRDNPDYMGDITYNETTRTMSIKPKSGINNFRFWSYRRIFIKNSTLSLQHPNISASYYYIFDQNGDLQVVEQHMGADIFYNSAIVWNFYWNANTQKAEIIQASDEQHGVDYSPKEHLYNHLVNGFTTASENSNVMNGVVDAGTTYTSFNAGMNFDEDIIITTAEILTTPFIYRINGINDWEQSLPDNLLSFKNGGTVTVYNKEVGGVYGLYPCASDTDYVIYYAIKTNDISHPIKQMVGTQVYPNRGAARDDLKNNLHAIKTTGLPGPEIEFIYAYIIKKNGTLEDDGDGHPLIDLRGIKINSI